MIVLLIGKIRFKLKIQIFFNTFRTKLIFSRNNDPCSNLQSCFFSNQYFLITRAEHVFAIFFSTIVFLPVTDQGKW